ncbi:MAG: leucyl aminopeptidase [Burkholderiaceae bacterium]|jgi:leucyl aminopeptidase|nr:leucyl aminopeptidase [Burkholderiaceae bacterium]
MDFSIKTEDKKNALHNMKTDCIAVGIYENKILSSAARALDADGAITAVLQSGDLTGKPGSSLLLRHIKGIAAPRVLLIGLGKDEIIAEKDFSVAAKTLTQAFSSLGAKTALVALPLDKVRNRPPEWAIASVFSAANEKAYRSDAMKSKKDSSNEGVRKITFYLPGTQAATARDALARASAIAKGVNLAKDLGNLPANVCTPAYLAEQAKKLAAAHQFDIQALDKKQLQSLKMGSFLSVAKGSDEPPKFIVLRHNGGKAKEAPVVLVGKGLTFDSGGISLKPGAAMDEMKYDMCGAATVLGVFAAIGEMRLRQNIIGIIPSCENMPSGHANKPGDIVTSMSGQTIEILNTDAEGRLILCDALTYAERFRPETVIDIATLTGACIVALGHHNSGLFTRDDEAHNLLAADLLAAGKASGDTAWRMPIEDAYQEQLKSNFADMANIGGQPGGSVTAACFLERFTRSYTWAHLDIAGTAWKSGAAKGATGRPVPLLCTWLFNRENAS